MNRIIDLIIQDPVRVRALQCAAKLDLPDWFLAAGFVRNLVWDQLHAMPKPTPLNDVDVIYFDCSETDRDIYLTYELQLTAMMPELNWQVRNQAFMHIRNGDNPYTNSLDAMSYWPEKETAIGVRLIEPQQYLCQSPFGYQSLFELKVTHNPKRCKAVFDQRVATKGWLTRWPKLTLASD